MRKSANVNIKNNRHKLRKGRMFFCRMMMSFLLLSGLLAAGQLTSVQAQIAAPGVPAELEALMLEALGFSPVLAVNQAQIEAQQAREQEVRSLPDPEINLGYFLNPAESSTVPGRFTLSAMQMFPWFGYYTAAQQQQRELSGAEEQRYFETALGLILEVQLAWLDLAENRYRQDLLQEEVALLEELESWLAARHESGLARQSERIALRMERSRLRTQLQNLEEARHPMYVRLNSLLSRDPDSELTLTVEVPERELPAAWEHITRNLAENRPELQLYVQQSRALKQAAEQNRLMGMPEFGLGFEVMGRDYGTMNMMPSMNESFFLMASVRVPLWRGKYDGRRDAIEAGRRATEYSREAALLRIRSEAEKQLNTWREARREMALYDEELLTGFSQLYSLELESYAASDTGFRELLQLRREWLDARQSRLQAWFRAERELARIERETGAWLPLVRDLR
ncbi:Outer membrane protein TolC [Cyclonatronum proteinivorum]|uniref:Outer membrane protein TolC n=1 Tax=Cyclonatronum proteinivorum TaxID=1457365 RepID=A0A345UGD9_9BACT|nr:TolC family protein [Cyclonatronum proteinivorum]AXI99540.1 Outer membrane protein TolC [Cyclonatronum proteinivorum]